jgi:competence protein ComEC
MRRRLLLLLLSLSLLPLFGCRAAPDELRIHILDVGQGDAILLRLPEGDVLIDAGPEAGEQTLCTRLDELGVDSLELLFLTHPDEDHIGGADALLSRIPVGAIYLGGRLEGTDSYRALDEAARAVGISPIFPSAGDVIELGRLSIRVLLPEADGLREGNAGSLVLKLLYGEFEALFTGDVGVEEESRLIALYGAEQLSSTLLKVGHHGSRTSTGEELVRAVQPKIAVISAGDENAYGHPMGVVVSRLESADAEVLRTDREGEIVLVSDGRSVERLH